jgi:hypothetical protein
MLKPYHELLREVRDSLTLENWIKGNRYFYNRNNNLCMSVHGAAQRLVNPEVAKILENNIKVNNVADGERRPHADRPAAAAYDNGREFEIQ